VHVTPAKSVMDGHFHATALFVEISTVLGEFS